MQDIVVSMILMLLDISYIIVAIWKHLPSILNVAIWQH